MDEYIRKQDVLNLPQSTERNLHGEIVERSIDVKDIEALKPADVAPVIHGKWVWLSSTYDRNPCERRFWCSRCHHEVITHDSDPWEKFCPNCGARMDGGKED